jgi:hypothetical protein
MVTVSVLKPIPVVVKIATQVSRHIALRAMSLGILHAAASRAKRKPQGRPHQRLVRLFSAYSPWRQFDHRLNHLLFQQLPLFMLVPPQLAPPLNHQLILPLWPFLPPGWTLTVVRALLFLLFLLWMFILTDAEAGGQNQRV